MSSHPSVLVYGFGNLGREDDGAGIVLAERIRAAALPGVTTDSNYQLNVEDALLLTEYDMVIIWLSLLMPPAIRLMDSGFLGWRA